MSQSSGSHRPALSASQTQALPHHPRAHDCQPGHRSADADVQQRVAHVVVERDEDDVIGFETLCSVHGLAHDVAFVGQLP